MKLKIAAGCGIEIAYVGPSLLLHPLSDPLRELIIKQGKERSVIRKRGLGRIQGFSKYRV